MKNKSIIVGKKGCGKSSVFYSLVGKPFNPILDARTEIVIEKTDKGDFYDIPGEMLEQDNNILAHRLKNKKIYLCIKWNQPAEGIKIDINKQAAKIHTCCPDASITIVFTKSDLEEENKRLPTQPLTWGGQAAYSPTEEEKNQRLDDKKKQIASILNSQSQLWGITEAYIAEDGPLKPIFTTTPKNASTEKPDHSPTTVMAGSLERRAPSSSPENASNTPPSPREKLIRNAAAASKLICEENAIGYGYSNKNLIDAGNTSKAYYNDNSKNQQPDFITQVKGQIKRLEEDNSWWGFFMCCFFYSASEKADIIKRALTAYQYQSSQSSENSSNKQSSLKSLRKALRQPRGFSIFEAPNSYNALKRSYDKELAKIHNSR